MPEDIQRRHSPSQEQRVLDSKLKRNAHWVALVGGLIPAVTAAIISIMTAWRGEPEANRAYEILAPQLNAQRLSLQAVLSRLSKIEGHYEGREIGKLEAQIESLMRENEQLRGKVTIRSPSSVKKSKDPQCKEGYVLGQDQRCHKVKKTVAAKIKATELKLREKQKWLQREKEQRARLEQKVKVLQQNPRPQVPLQAVPETLREASW